MLNAIKPVRKLDSQASQPPKVVSGLSLVKEVDT